MNMGVLYVSKDTRRFNYKVPQWVFPPHSRLGAHLGQQLVSVPSAHGMTCQVDLHQPWRAEARPAGGMGCDSHPSRRPRDAALSRKVWQRDDIVVASFDPMRGQEQQGRRPGMVVTHAALNRLGMILDSSVDRLFSSISAYEH